MDNPSVYTTLRCARTSASAMPLASLIELLLSDVATDVEVVARELGMRNEMLERLRRALDRLNCAQSVLEAMGQGRCAGAGERDGSDELEDACCHEEGAAKGARDAVTLLAEGWPQDYPDGAVEWEILRQSG